MNADIQMLRQRFSQMEDEDLLRIVGEEASDYRPEAIEAAREEIRARGLATAGPTQRSAPTDPANPEPEEHELLDEGPEEGEVPEPEAFTCAACGRGLRSAVLLADNQIIAVFEDNREARFVKILVCPRCGTADMFVDMHTPVVE